MIIITLILLIAIAVLSYLLYASYKRYKTLIQYTEAYVQFISSLYFTFTTTRDKLKEIDRRGSFAADDEVGFVFKEIDSNIEELYNFITKYVNATTEGEEESKK